MSEKPNRREHKLARLADWPDDVFVTWPHQLPLPTTPEASYQWLLTFERELQCVSSYVDKVVAGGSQAEWKYLRQMLEFLVVKARGLEKVLPQIHGQMNLHDGLPRNRGSSLVVEPMPTMNLRKE